MLAQNTETRMPLPFPYSHMTEPELIQAAEDSGNLLALALAAQLELYRESIADNEEEVKEKDKTIEELKRANRELDDSVERLADKISSALEEIPASTSHKGLIAIREILRAE